jgi:arsenate reductase
MQTLKVLFLCTGNSCRSQMAEGWARRLKGDRFQVYSAGVKPAGLNPDAVRVMAEAGVDISGHKSKHVEQLAETEFDYVVTVCDDAHESCPVFPGGAKMIHRSFDDPPRLSQSALTEGERLAPYRRVRDEIRDFVASLPEGLDGGSSTDVNKEVGIGGRQTRLE